MDKLNNSKSYDFFASNGDYLSKDIEQKVELTLLDHVYSQLILGLGSSLICAGIIFIGFYDPTITQIKLNGWFVFFIVVTIARTCTALFYRIDQQYKLNNVFWRNIYFMGSVFGGISWGMAAFLLLPTASPSEQTLLVLLLAGVTAGGTALSSAVPSGAIAFLICAIIPFILSLLAMPTAIFQLFNSSLLLYLGFSIFFVMRNHQILRKSILATFKIQELLKTLELSNQQLEHASTHDPLTQVSNRRLFSSIITTAISRAKASNKRFALLYLDLDKFKLINDLYSHEAGDQVLLAVSMRLRKYFRRDDIIARLGGDEFAVIVENVDNRADVKRIADKICQLVAEPVSWHGLQLQVSGSVGIAFYPEDGTDEETLVRCSDAQMYRAKNQGGNQFNHAKISVSNS